MVREIDGGRRWATLGGSGRPGNCIRRLELAPVATPPRPVSVVNPWRCSLKSLLRYRCGSPSTKRRRWWHPFGAGVRSPAGRSGAQPDEDFTSTLSVLSGTSAGWPCESPDRSPHRPGQPRQRLSSPARPSPCSSLARVDPVSPVPSHPSSGSRSTQPRSMLDIVCGSLPRMVGPLLECRVEDERSANS